MTSYASNFTAPYSSGLHSVQLRNWITADNIWRDPWKNWICSTTMKLRKSLVKPVTWQKTCNYIELFGSSARDHYARRRIWCFALNICRYYVSCMMISSGRTI